MSRRTIWTTAFLTVTAAAVGMELYAAFDASDNTAPWTELISTWWPAPVTFAAIGLLTVWLGPHFRDAYRKRGTMAVEQIPVPPSREADARNRAARTLFVGLGVDVGVALILAVGPKVLGSDFAWTREYWSAIGLLAASTVIKASVSYFARKAIPPKFAPAREVSPVNDPNVIARPAVD